MGGFEPRFVNTKADFVSDAQTSCHGAKEILLPILQRYRVLRFPSLGRTAALLL